MRLLLALVPLLCLLPGLAGAQDRPPPPAPWAYGLDEPGRGPVYMVTGADARYSATGPEQLTLTVRGVTFYPNYTNLTLTPVLTLEAPADGLYDALFLGTPPMELTMATPDNVEVQVTWQIRQLPDALRIHAQMNCLVVLLAAAEPPPAVTDCEVVRPAGMPPAP